MPAVREHRGDQTNTPTANLDVHTLVLCLDGVEHLVEHLAHLFGEIRNLFLVLGNKQRETSDLCRESGSYNRGYACRERTYSLVKTFTGSNLNTLRADHELVLGVRILDTQLLERLRHEKGLDGGHNGSFKTAENDGVTLGEYANEWDVYGRCLRCCTSCSTPSIRMTSIVWPRPGITLTSSTEQRNDVENLS